MEFHSPEQREADAKAIAAHRCPETGVDLKPMTSSQVESHIVHTFPHGDETVHQTTDYGRRYRALRAYQAERFKGGK